MYRSSSWLALPGSYSPRNFSPVRPKVNSMLKLMTVPSPALHSRRLRRWLLTIALLMAIFGPLAAQETGRPLDTTIGTSQMLDYLRQDPALLEKVKAVAIEKFAAPPVSIAAPPVSIKEEPNPGRHTPASTRPESTGAPTEVVRPVDGPAEGEEPGLERRPIPHLNLTSLNELYSQLPATGGKVKRFGGDVFQNGSGNSDELPMDLPAGPDYVLGPGDLMILNLWGGHSERSERTVDRQGQIALPEAGSVVVAGLTITQAQETIRKALAGQFRAERVEIALGRVRSVRVYVVGDVQRPGAYDISSLSTALNALYAAGGPTANGSLRLVRHIRGSQLLAEVDLYEFLLHGIRAEGERLLPGDTLLVPPVGAQVTVAGMVRRPAIYELKGEQNLAELVELAGGPLVSASLKQIKVERVEAHQRRTMLNAAVTDAAQAKEKLAGFHVQDGDHVLISPILPYNEQMVFLEGHVFRPGRYAYHDGMQLSELLPSYQEVMPEPSERAEIIRLRAPDYRPETIPFSLSGVLTGNEIIGLEPFDVVRVLGRYEADPPKVSIKGAVVRPGQYPLTRGMTVAGLVEMAGGFQRSAFRQTADLSSYVVRGGEQVILERREVAIGQAIAGDRHADVVLKPGDVVGIRQLRGWQDIGASVTVSGEVGYAGTYGIQIGERLSSVLRRAGGFRESAYPEGAVLERKQVGELAEKSRQEMIRRIEAGAPTVQSSLAGGQEQLQLLLAMQVQQQQVLTSLRSRPASSRLIVKLSSRISDWENTPADLEIRADDTLFIPKRPNFVLIAGQVHSPEAVTYLPGKNADWYLAQAGGATRSGNRKDIFIVRADGSVVGPDGSAEGRSMSTAIRPGDAIVVPEKVLGGPPWWRGLIATAQLMSSVAITGSAAKLY